MRFAILGPVRFDDGTGWREIPGVKLRTVLATLLVEANSAVSVDRLGEELWGPSQPASPAGMYNHLSRLRRILGDAEGERIQSTGHGYLIRVGPGELDVDVFDEHCGDGRRAAAEGRWAQAAQDLAAALALWRGQPLADVPSAGGWRLGHLEEARIQALELRIEADLQLGRHQAVIGELLELAARFPLHEQFHRQLMLALYRAGRQAEALNAFLAVRRTLVDELGVEPSSELRALHRLILQGDPQLAAPSAKAAEAAETDAASATDDTDKRADVASSPPPPPPAQLPAEAGDFTGRDAVVKHLCDLLHPTPAEGPARMLITAVTGMGGIGKTALALHVAHRLAAHFPDGQLYVELHGAASPARDPAQALGEMLRGLGVADADVPADPQARAAQLRTLTSGRRMLIVLDDSRDAAQIRPLLPGGGTCRVLVTSRSTLPGLAGVVRVNLAPLDPPEALDLFTGIVGADRVYAEGPAVDEVLGYCAGLPLAVRIAASRLAVRPAWTVASMAARLAEERRRLDELRTEDVAVRAGFRMSYAQLDDSAPAGPARVFRLLGLFPGRDLTAHAAAALFGLPLERAEDLLERLVDANLLQAPAPERYRLHDLLRSYAAELVQAEETAEERQAAAQRLVCWYVYACHQAVQQLDAVRPGPPPAELTRAEPRFDPGGREHALAWLDSERLNILAVVWLADVHGPPAATWLLARSVKVYYGLRAHWSDYAETCTIGLANARAAGDGLAESRMLNALGALHSRTGEYDLALTEAGEALAIHRAAGDLGGQAAGLNTLGSITYQAGRHEQAIDWYEQSVRLRRQLGDDSKLALAIGNLALALTLGGRHQEAVEHCFEAMALARKDGMRFMEATCLTALGEAYLGLGRHDEAVDSLREGAAVYRKIGNQPAEGDTLEQLGAALLADGRAQEAREALIAAIVVYEACGDERAAAVVRTRLGDLRT
jgi:DNA-binding SARP family transcriptional activator